MQMHVQSAGERGPVIIFVHGYTCDASDWVRQIEALSDTLVEMSVLNISFEDVAADCIVLSDCIRAGSLSNTRDGEETSLQKICKPTVSCPPRSPSDTVGLLDE